MNTVLYLLLCFSASTCCFGQDTIPWSTLSKTTFELAEKENKIILLNLEANWCHWCHVMHDSTYSDPKIIAYLNENFIAVKADQDANPELAVRYRDYGWPATVFLNAQGEDVVKRSGYIPPKRFLKLLKAIVEDPSPEEIQAKLTELDVRDQSDSELLMQLETNFKNSLDYDVGGFDQSQKYVEFDSFEYALFASQDPKVKTWLKKSAEGAKQLSDPVWGGIYQYSTHYDWKHLHYEKLLSIQARYIRIFSYNYLFHADTISLDYAKKCVEFADDFLSSKEGLYYNAQDADLKQGEHAAYYFELNDSERRKLGIPAVDKNSYTHNNADMANSLLFLFQVTNDSVYLQKARSILNYLIHNRKQNNGLYRHAKESDTILSLRDNVAMLDLLVQHVKFFPQEESIANELSSLMKALKANFILYNGGYKGFIGENGLSPLPILSENIRVSRLMNWYGHYSNDSAYIKIAQNNYRFLIQKEVAAAYYSEPALLLLRTELNSTPLEHVLLSPVNSDNTLERTMKTLAPFYSTFSVCSKAELPLEKKEFFAAFEGEVLLVCTANTCSSPLYTAINCLQYYRRINGIED